MSCNAKSSQEGGKIEFPSRILLNVSMVQILRSEGLVPAWDGEESGRDVQQKSLWRILV
jgi:hypothetical protein